VGAGHHGRPGVALTEVRQAFERLIAQGVSNSEACRVVGINRRTGTRWRYGRDIPATGGRTLHYPPVITTRQRRPTSARFLSEEERITISDLRRTGATVRAIAAELGRSPSTISRELRRNVDPAGRYRPSAAHRCAAGRRTRRRARRVDRDDALRAHVQQLLALRWSPEQISRALRSSLPVTQRGSWSPSRSISHLRPKQRRSPGPHPYAVTHPTATTQTTSTAGCTASWSSGDDDYDRRPADDGFRSC